MTDTASQDLLSRLAGITPASAAGQSLAQRHKIVDSIQNCHALFFSQDIGDGLDAPERIGAALLVCRQAGITALAQYYADQLPSLPGAGSWQQLAQQETLPADAPPRAAAIERFVLSVAADPASADPLALQALQQAGLSTPAIVLLAQLVGFVSFQVRLLAGWQAWRALDASATPQTAQDNTSFIHPANLPPPGQALRINGFTSETLDWKAWLPVLDPEQATAQQEAVLQASHPKARTSDFYLLLALQPDILHERSTVFNTIMYAPGGLPRAERELATAVVSRINRCVYCLSVHAQRFEQLAKRNDVIAQLFRDPGTAGTNQRERAIVHLASAITSAPSGITLDTLSSMSAAGFSSLEILDAINASALFAWANRLMLNLGEAVTPA
ncbi:CMD domain-containing protein [Paracandidimonas soli]|uniref:CMD domain-containing protein n=1 Tax=Paracandidimonas soli TaxID=1917182 RepID=UPI003340CB8E